jgi:hypothetical protein
MQRTSVDLRCPSDYMAVKLKKIKEKKKEEEEEGEGAESRSSE